METRRSEVCPTPTPTAAPERRRSSVSVEEDLMDTRRMRLTSIVCGVELPLPLVVFVVDDDDEEEDTPPATATELPV